MDEKPGEYVFAKVVSVAEKSNVVITSNVDTTCHRLPNWGQTQIW